MKRDISKNVEREDVPKDYYREKQYYREKEAYREKEYREKDAREKELYRDREMKEKEAYREKEVYREKDPYREREQYREREMYRENSFRDPRNREAYREKEMYKEKDVPRDRDMYTNRERQFKYTEAERKRSDSDRIESRLRVLAEETHGNHNNEKENRDKTSGDKELEDLRSRLLSKRISKELQTQETKRHSDYVDKGEKLERHSSLDKHQQDRRKRLIEAGRHLYSYIDCNIHTYLFN